MTPPNIMIMSGVLHDARASLNARFRPLQRDQAADFGASVRTAGTRNQMSQQAVKDLIQRFLNKPLLTPFDGPHHAEKANA